jgi:hypothetical protein
MQVLDEEILSFWKVTLNLDFYLTEKLYKKAHKIIELNLIETKEYFFITPNKNNLISININSFVEFYGCIRKISGLKACNKIIKFCCSECGVIYSRNCEQFRNHKSLNSFFMNPEKNFHCKNQDSDDYSNHKIIKEYSDLKILRYFQ